MSMFLLLFAIELGVKLRPVTYTWKESMVFDMTTIFDLEIFKYTVLLTALSLKKKKIVELQYSPCPTRAWDAKYLSLHFLKWLANASVNRKDCLLVDNKKPGSFLPLTKGEDNAKPEVVPHLTWTIWH